MQQLNLLDSNTIATYPVQFFPQFLQTALADRYALCLQRVGGATR
jgi:hypothetical protein